MKSQVTLSNAILTMKEQIKQETINDPEKWITIDLKTMQTSLELPQYLCRLVLSILRVDPELRYKLMDAQARFKPKAYRIATPEEKIKDIGSIRQFEIPEADEKTLINRLSQYQNAEDVKKLYILLYICEKLKIQGFDQEWKTIPFSEYAKSVNASKLELLQYLDILFNKGILKKSPITNMYKLAVTEEDSKIIDKYIEKIIIDNDIELQGENNLTLLSEDSNVFTELQELEKMRANIGTLVKYSNKVSDLIVEQLALCDTLAKKDSMLKTQKTAFIRLNEAYNETNENNEKLKEENQKLKNDYKILSKFNDNRTAHIQDQTNILAATLSTLVEDYIKLPLHKKNEVATSAKFKFDITEAIMSASKKIIDFKPESVE